MLMCVCLRVFMYVCACMCVLLRFSLCACVCCVYLLRCCLLFVCASQEGLVIWESHAVLQYLCNKHELDQWRGKTLGDRAKVNQALDWYLILTIRFTDSRTKPVT
jgi:hypothetical protein